MQISRSVLILSDNHFQMNTVKTNGGVVDVSCSEILINNCSFMNNSAYHDGGVINCVIAVDSSIFHSNVVSQDGGAIVMGDTNLTFCHSTFENNTATYGGGIAAQDSNITEINVHFIKNKAVELYI